MPGKQIVKDSKMSLKDSIQGISFVSINTNDTDKFLELYKFYNNLGFKLTKNYSKVSNNSTASASNDPKLHLGISNDSLKELWLESFPLQDVDELGNPWPWQELSVYQGDNTEKLCTPTVIKVRLSCLHEIDESPKKLQLFTTNLPEVKKILKTNGYEYKEEDVYLLTVDPIGNKIFFSNFEDPITKKTFKTSKEYLKYKSDKILHETKSETAKKEEPEEEKKRLKKIAIMTSGGDAPGMNPAVRAVVRAGIYMGCDVFAIYEGYDGLVKGGDMFRQMSWKDVRSLLAEGGTAIGTARSAEFREHSGRLKAAYNMIINGIDALIVCGGDGSLTGADIFRGEWPSLLKELVDKKELTSKQIEPFKTLTICGLVGSIDNDMACTDATIGAYSALARITEMVDFIDATATSHSRAFVVEVMGRHCGWLGLMAGISTGADFIFIPERPPPAGKWKDDLKKVCLTHRQKGRRKTTVIVAEGAIDDDLNPITSEQVKNFLVEMGLDTRITTLGHVQRGGTAVAYDRMLATMQGVEAVKAVLESTPDTPSPMIGILENKIVRQPLIEAVKLTKSVATAIENKEFEKAISLRDCNFEDAYKNFMATSINGPKEPENSNPLNIGIIHVGAPSSGLNAATRAATLYCLSKGHKAFAICNGFSGFIATGSIQELKWLDVESWNNKGGSEIGTNRSLPSEDYGKVAFYLQKFNIQGLLIIGGFEGFTALHQLRKKEPSYPIFGIPKIVIPATVSNNVPGTEYSLGSDTCLNQLVDYCDAVMQSASSSRRRVFVVEVQGGHSGFVASYCGLVTGSIATYTPESKINLRVIQEDIQLLYDVFRNDRGEDKNGKMMIRNEQASSVYTSELIADIIKESANGRFETRTAIPGHVQQGFTPSSMDRVQAVRFAVKSVEYIEEWNSTKNNSVVIGIQGAQVRFTDVEELYNHDANVLLRKGKKVHWTDMIKISDMLNGRLLLREKRKPI